MRLLVLSFTEKGSHLNRQLCLQMSQMGYFCEGYAPSKYAKCADLKTLDKDISECCVFIYRRGGHCCADDCTVGEG